MCGSLAGPRGISGVPYRSGSPLRRLLVAVEEEEEEMEEVNDARAGAAGGAGPTGVSSPSTSWPAVRESSVSAVVWEEAMLCGLLDIDDDMDEELRAVGESILPSRLGHSGGDDDDDGDGDEDGDDCEKDGTPSQPVRMSSPTALPSCASWPSRCRSASAGVPVDRPRPAARPLTSLLARGLSSFATTCSSSSSCLVSGAWPVGAWNDRERNGVGRPGDGENLLRFSSRLASLAAALGSLPRLPTPTSPVLGSLSSEKSAEAYRRRLFLGPGMALPPAPLVVLPAVVMVMLLLAFCTALSSVTARGGLALRYGWTCGEPDRCLRP